MSPQECPNTPKCPIFSGILQGSQYTETYKSLFCLAGEEGRNKCRRYQVSQKVGKCPANVLPNSSKSVDEIIAEMKAKGEI
ncbi:MAG: hypothetical protein JXB34_12555 [Bacteroidales bacterium]|nr:hypothetical protein [Bacteroidales bacterium]